MKNIILFTLIFTFMAGAIHAEGERDFSDVQIKTIKVNKNISMLEGSGGNIGVVHGADGLLLIDDQFAPLSDKIKKALSKFEPSDVKYLLNTHWHADHTGGNIVFGKESTIISHENVRKRLNADQFITLFDKTIKASPKEALPDITFKEAVDIHFNDQEIRVRHYPNGHTDGDSVIYFPKANVLHTGDLFFNGMYPFIDLEHGGSVEGYIHNVQSLLMIVNEETKIIPGHGKLASYEDFRNFLNMLHGTSQFVHQQIKEGMSLEEIQKMGMPKEWDTWKKGFLKDEVWISILYADLSAKQ